MAISVVIDYLLYKNGLKKEILISNILYSSDI